MQTNGTIALVMPKIAGINDHDLIAGVYETAARCGMDTVILTDIFNAMDQETTPEYDSYGYREGLENIYTLLEQGKFDGVLLTSGRFQSPRLKTRLMNIVQRSGLPTVLLEAADSRFVSVYPEQRRIIRQITEHLITAHHCKKLWCITGIQGELNSEERLAGFTEAMEAASLPVERTGIFYGWFWRELPYQIGCEIAEGKREKPDAIVCASDSMAIALCRGLTEHGMRVPEDIAVTGYDGSHEALVHDPQITTAAGREFALGVCGVEKLLHMIGRAMPELPDTRQAIRFGSSCGCQMLHSGQSTTDHLFPYLQKQLAIYDLRRDYISNDRLSRLTGHESLQSLLHQVNLLTFLLPNWEHLDIALCSDLLPDYTRSGQIRTEGYSETMQLVMSKRFGIDTEPFGFTFPISEVLPPLHMAHTPRIWILTALHARRQALGYLSTSYSDPYAFLIDDYYVGWCDAVAHGLHELEQTLYRAYLRQQYETLTDRDPATGLYNQRVFLEHLPMAMAECEAQHSRCAVILLRLQGEFEKLLSAASVLRLDPDSCLLLARTEESVLACAVTASNVANTDEFLNAFLILLDGLISCTYGGAVQIGWQETASLCVVMQRDHLPDAERLLEDCYKQLHNQLRTDPISAGNYRERLLSLHCAVYSHPELAWNIERMAAELNVSRSHFQRLYSEMFHTSCVDDVIHARIEKAKRLLLTTEQKIRDIAEQCGYLNVSHFMRQFRSKTGVTAKFFRENGEPAGGM